MPRLVRRKPLLDRIKDYLNPGDFLLWLSEEIETRDWDSKHFATPLAIGLHFTLLIARANTGGSGSSKGDDVFGDDYSRTGWLSFIVVYPSSFPRDALLIDIFNRLPFWSTYRPLFLCLMPRIHSHESDTTACSNLPSMLLKTLLLPAVYV